MSKPLIVWGSTKYNDGTLAAMLAAFNHKEADFLNLSLLNLSPAGDCLSQKVNLLRLGHKLAKTGLVVCALPLINEKLSPLIDSLFMFLGEACRDCDVLTDALAGCRLALIAHGTALHLPLGAEAPVRWAARQLNMDYAGSVYFYTGQDGAELLKNAARMTQFRRMLCASEPRPRLAVSSEVVYLQ